MNTVVVRPPLQQSGGSGFFTGGVTGALLYFNGSVWTGFPPSATPGDILTSQGPGLPPLWQSAAGGGYLTTNTLWSNDLGGMGSAPSVQRVQGVTPGTLGLALLRATGTGAAEDLIIYRGGVWTTFTAGTDGTLLGYTGGQLTAQSIALWGLQPLNANLTALANNVTNGLWARTGVGTGSARTLQGTASLVTVSNGDGVSGNPTINVGANVYQVGGTDVAVTDGGTGASTAVLARFNLAANGGGWRTTASGTDTLTGSDGTVEYSASCTITLPLASENGVFVGKQITLIAATAGVVLTLQRAGSDTLNGGTASVAVTMPTARGAIAVVAQSATAWGSVQPGIVAVSLLIADIASSAFRAAGYASVNGAWVRVTDYYPPTYTQDPEAWGFSLAGADINVTTAAGVVNANLRTEAPGWGWDLSTFGVGSLANQRLGSIDAAVTSITLTAATGSDQNGVVGVYSTASNLSTNAMYACGIGKPNTNYAWLRGMANALIGAYSISPNMRRVQSSHLIPLLSGADPYEYAFDAGGAVLSAGGLSAANTASGTPTSFGVFLVKLGTPRAGLIAAPVVAFYLGA